MHTILPPSACYAPKGKARERVARLLFRRRYVATTTLLAAGVLASALPGGSSAHLDGRDAAYCALALPPSQISRRVELEIVYCKGLSGDRQCQADFGWIVVSEPVLCD